MKTTNPFLLLLIVIVFSACNQSDNKKISSNDFRYTWKDEGTLAFTDVDNYAIGYAAGDKESLDKALAGFILNSIDRSDLEFFDEENKKITAEQAKDRLTQTTSFKRENPEEKGEYFYESVQTPITADKIAQVVAREDWFFDEKSYTINKRVTHLAPVIYVFDTDGDVMGKKLVFWVKVN